jgi:hypothetical protein
MKFPAFAVSLLVWLLSATVRAEPPLIEFKFAPSEQRAGGTYVSSGSWPTPAWVVGPNGLKTVGGRTALKVGKGGSALVFAAPACGPKPLRLEYDSWIDSCGEGDSAFVIPAGLGAAGHVHLSLSIEGSLSAAGTDKSHDESDAGKTTCAPRRWRHVVITVDNHGVRATVEGKKTGTLARGDLDALAGRVVVGGDTTWVDNDFEGYVTNVRFFGAPASGPKQPQISWKLALEPSREKNLQDGVAWLHDQSPFKNDMFLLDAKFEPDVRPGSLRVFRGWTRSGLRLDPEGPRAATYSIALWFFAPTSSSRILELGSEEDGFTVSWSREGKVGIETVMPKPYTSEEGRSGLIADKKPTIWSADRFAVSRWHHLLIQSSRSSGRATLFVDGLPQIHLPAPLTFDDTYGLQLGGENLNVDRTYNPAYGALTVSSTVDEQAALKSFESERSIYTLAPPPVVAAAPIVRPPPQPAAEAPAEPPEPVAEAQPSPSPELDTSASEAQAEEEEEQRRLRKEREQAEIDADLAEHKARMAEEMRQFNEGLKASNETWQHARDVAEGAEASRNEARQRRAAEESQAAIDAAAQREAQRKAERDRAAAEQQKRKEQEARRAACPRGNLTFNQFGKMAFETNAQIHEVEDANTDAKWRAEKQVIRSCIVGICMPTFARDTQEANQFIAWANKAALTCEGLTERCGAVPQGFDFGALQVDCLSYVTNEQCLGSLHAFVEQANALETFNACAIQAIENLRAP